ncbi:MAG: virulence factor [Paracoccaceae bacterium]
MAQVVVVYWRDIPAQVIVREGRRAAKRELSPRFVEAIDRCAMRTGARGEDAYLADWRRAAPEPAAGEIETLADVEAARLEAEYPPDTVRALVERGGWSTVPHA